MYSVFVISAFIYKRGAWLSDWWQSLVYYGLLVCILFFFNLIKRNKIKCLVFAFVFFLPFTFIYFTGIYVADFNSIYVLITGGPINVPFLPDRILLSSKNQIINSFSSYLLFFVLPIIYLYGLYILSKKIEKKLFIQKDHKRV
jgi:hypothetical protein